jgi:hypothetical protein
METFKKEFETKGGSGYLLITKRDETGRNDTYDIIVEEVYTFHNEDEVIRQVESDIYKYL